MPKVSWEDIGLMDYKEVWDYQESIFKKSIDIKIAARETQVIQNPENHVIFCQHPHVYTLGKSGEEEHLVISSEDLKNRGATFSKINRGGDITYHGPGRLV